MAPKVFTRPKWEALKIFTSKGRGGGALKKLNRKQGMLLKFQASSFKIFIPPAPSLVTLNELSLNSCHKPVRFGVYTKERLLAHSRLPVCLRKKERQIQYCNLFVWFLNLCFLIQGNEEHAFLPATIVCSTTKLLAKYIHSTKLTTFCPMTSFTEC